MFLNRLIQNAEESTPITNSASNEARTLLSETLDLMGMMLKTKKTRKKYKNSIGNGLESMARSKMIIWDTNSPADTIPLRAQALLRKHY